MSRGGDLFSDMPNLPWNRQPSSLTPDELALEALLSGAPLPVDAPRDAYLVGDVVTALRAPATADELNGFASASAAYRKRYASSPRHGRTPRWRPAMLGSLLSARGAAALAAGAIGLGGIGTAAYAGALPNTAQDVAHHLIGAPAGHPGKGHGNQHGKGHAGTESKVREAGTPSATSTSASTPVGPDATGRAAFGLCTAYQHAKADGQAAEVSVAFRNLATAAGGQDKITAYCASVPHPGSTSSRHGKPTDLPSQAGRHRTGKPSPVPSHPADGANTPALPTGGLSSVPVPSPSHPTGP